MRRGTLTRMAASAALVLSVAGGALAIALAPRPGAPPPGPVPLGLQVSGTAHARDIGAGDRVERVYVLTNPARTILRRLSIEIVALEPRRHHHQWRRPSILVRGHPGGLRVSVQQCARPWVPTPDRPAYWCPGGPRTLVAWHRLPVRTRLGRMHSVLPGGRANLRVTTMLLDSSPQSLSRRGVRISTRFTGIWWR